MCSLSSWIKTVMQNKGIKFKEVNLLEHKLKNNIITDNTLKAPLIEIGNAVIIGFDKEAIKNKENPIARYLYD